jgi:hypothetical protein
MATRTGYLSLDLRALHAERGGEDTPEPAAWLARGGAALLDAAEAQNLFKEDRGSVWPLFLIACGMGRVDLMRWFLDRFAPPREVALAGFGKVCGSGDAGAAQWLRGALAISPADAAAARPFYRAAARGDVATAAWLVETLDLSESVLDEGPGAASPDRETAFEVACLLGHLNFVRWLVDTFAPGPSRLVATRPGRQRSLFADLALLLKRDALAFLQRGFGVTRAMVAAELPLVVYHQGDDAELMKWLGATFGVAAAEEERWRAAAPPRR